MISLWTAASGMESMKFKIEVIANNLANTNTDGFKRMEVNFNDILYQYRQGPAAIGNPTGISVGLGSKVSGTIIRHKQGSLKVTDNQTDLAINGRGFFQVLDAVTSQRMYTRDGSFRTDAQGRLVSVHGHLLQPQITIAPEQSFSHVDENGSVWARDVQGLIQQIGQLQVSLFPNPGGLQAIGNSMYIETVSSAAPQILNPKTGGAGSIVGGAVEASNVQIVHEMVDLIATQKAFDTNSKVVSVSDKMMDTANNLTR